MRSSLGILGGVALLAAFLLVPAHVQGQQPAAQAERPGMMNQSMMNPDMMKMMSDMKARDAKLEALVQKMNAAKGAAKTEAIAELLTALVEDRQATRSSMMGMMNMMGPMSGHAPADHDKPKQ